MDDELRTTGELVLVGDPAPRVRRITPNRPAERNAPDASLRRALLDAVRTADRDPAVGAVVVRGAGADFCAGYDLDPGTAEERDGGTGSGPGRFQRGVVEGRLPLADLVYVATDARIGCPAVRFGVPNLQYHAWLRGMRRAMEQVLAGDVMTGEEAVAAGLANRAFPAGELSAATVRIAARIAAVPEEVTQLNKRTVHRAMEAMGMRSAVRAGTETSAPATTTAGFQTCMAAAAGGRVTRALDARDAPFDDGRTTPRTASPTAEDQA
jgi:enoyl-CoA hydratase